MNMISTGAFLPETDASTKQNELVKKLTAAWEKKNSKTARAGGASLMALSLAACGGEDNTPFSAADVADAEAAATTAALTAADGVTVYDSVDAAVTAGEEAASADIVAEINSALGTSLTTADDAATIISTVQTSNDTEIADAARAEGVASVDITSDNTEVMMSQADYDAAIAAADDDLQATYDALVASNATLQAAYDALIAPASIALTTAADTAAMTGGNDTVTAAAGTVGATDRVIDGSSTDNDTLTIASTGNVAAIDVVNVESINVTITSSTASHTIDADDITGTSTLTVDRADLASGAIAGGAEIVVDNVNGDDVTVVAGSGVETLTVTMDAIGAVDAGTATTVTVNTQAANDAALVLTATSSTNTDVNDIGDDGATITLGTLASTDTGISLDIDAAATAADVAATVTAAGTVNVDADSADDLLNLNVSGNGAAVNYVMAAGANVDVYTVTGSQDVTISGAAADLTGEEMVNSLTAGTLTAAITTGGATDLSDAAVDAVTLASDINNTVTVASGVAIDSQINQTSLTIDSATDTVTTNSVTVSFTDDDADTDTTTDDADINVTTGALTFLDYASITLNAGAGITDVTATGVTITDSGNASSAISTDITITGSVDVTLGTVANATSVNGSALTGALSATIDEGSLTGGSGDDSLTMSDATEIMTVSGGAGDDTLTITDAGEGSTVDGGAGDDSISVTETVATVVDGGAGDDTITLNAATDTVIRGGDGSDEVVLANADYSALTNFSLSGIEVINVTAGDANILYSVLSANGDVQVIGDAATDELIVEGAATANDMDLSGTTFSVTQLAQLQIVGGAAADTIVGSSNNDIINGGAESDTLTGGAGADEFAIDDSVVATLDTITDFVVADDTISVGRTAATYEAITDDGTIAAAATLSAAVTAAYALATAGNNAGIEAISFEYGGNDYAAVEDTALTDATGAIVVQLDSVTGTLTVADFIA